VRTIAETLRGTSTAPADVARRPYGRGRIYWGGELSTSAPGELCPGYAATTSVLEAQGAIPDFRTSGPFRYAHRSLADREIYFVSNRSREKVTSTVVFRDGTRAAELWDAVTGEILRLPARIANPASGAEVTLRLDSFQSGFVVFYKNSLPEQRAASREGARAKERRLDLGGPWTVAFDPAWGAPMRIEFTELSDWTARPEDGIEHYSGIARDTKTFDLPGASPGNRS
jgi:hypothetical protein